jgi:hypothetical protein
LDGIIIDKPWENTAHRDMANLVENPRIINSRLDGIIIDRTMGRTLH